MSVLRAERIASTLLYEGYMLYPYRPSSVKNRQRFNFGVLFPEQFVDPSSVSDSAMMQTECVIEGTEATEINVKVRFLHLLGRRVGALREPVVEWRDLDDGMITWVDRLTVNGRSHSSWQEAVEREIGEYHVSLGALIARPSVRSFLFPAVRSSEAIRDEAERIVGVIDRQHHSVVGELELRARQLDGGVFAVRARVINRTSLPRDPRRTRDDALLHALVSTHTILAASGGAFVSALDPPPNLRGHVASCRCSGTWPVLAGEIGCRDTVLSSPIIIYDHPEVAPESPGELFDSTEIDEILSLRILTLTDDEKLEMAHADDRARALLERTEALGADGFMSLHGVMRASDGVEP